MSLYSRFTGLFRGRSLDADLDAELRSHIEMRAEMNRADGMSADEARRDALRRFGNRTLIKEDARRFEIVPWMESLGQDLRYAWRVLRKRAAFTTIAALTLGLGIGANTAIFSVVNAVFLRPLPFANAKRIYVVRRIGNRFGGASLSMPIFLEWQKANRFFEHLALLGFRGPASLTGSGDPERITSTGASTELFDVLGVRPSLGRNFQAEEGRPDGPRVVIISDKLWRNRFQGDANILGRALTLDGEPYTVVGVLPPRFAIPFSGISETDIWFPIRVPATSDNPSNGGLLCVGLLKPGATPAQAEASLTPPLAELRDRFPNMFVSGERTHLVPLRDFISTGAGTAPLLLFGAVVLVLLIACVNVANLLLAAASGRRHEMALRAAVGASRARIVRQLLTESVLLAGIGGALGVGACAALFGAISRMVPATMPRVGDFRIDGTVLAFALLVSVVTGVLFGLAPALGASGIEVNAVLKTSSSRTLSGGHAGLRRVLAANELALSLVLLVGAALALESLSRLMSVQPGFDASNLLTFEVNLPMKKYSTAEKRQAFFDQTLARFAVLPGVERAAATSLLPFVGGSDMLFTIEDGGDHAAGEKLGANIRIVSPEYFAALRIPQERGRTFADADRQGTLPVVLINHAAAKAFWPNGEPIGGHVWIGKPMGPSNAEATPRQIIGVVGDIHESSLAEPPEPTLYIPLAQNPSADGITFLLRTSRPPMASVADVRVAVRDIDPDLPLARVRTMQEVVDLSVQDWRFRAVLLGSFGALALFIAAIGVYGVISYSVAQRTQEIGVRVALGADRQDVLGLVLRQGMNTALSGIAIGLVAAFALTRVMANLLFGVNARDPLTFGAVAVLLGLVALGACYVPARRAMKVDPMVALRYE